jgi:hypothetical protein
MNRDYCGTLQVRLRAHSWQIIAMPHKSSTALVVAMIALSVFFVFRPQPKLAGIEPPLATLSGSGCVTHSAAGNEMPAEYTCEAP